MANRPITRALTRRLVYDIPYVQGRLPHDLYRHIFEFLARPHFEENLHGWIEVSEITPFLPEEERSALIATSLTCRHFKEIAYPLLLKHTCIHSLADFRRRLAMTRYRGPLPIETLTIDDNKSDAIRNMTSATFLSMMKKCDRLWSLSIRNPVITPSRLDFTLLSLSKCTFFTNITTLVLTMIWYDSDPDPEDLVRFIMLMPNLTRLHHHWDITDNSDDPMDIIPYPDLPPPPFQLEYLTVTQGYWNVDWLTSTSHKSLRCARIQQNYQDHKPFNLDHNWTALGSLHIFGNFNPEQVLQVLESSPNLVDFTWELDYPWCADGETVLMGFINALHRPLHHLTFWRDEDLVDSDEDSDDDVDPKYDYTVLAVAVQSHPNLSQLKSLAISLMSEKEHERCGDRFLPLKTACEARRIEFNVLCCNRCRNCKPIWSGRISDIQVIAGL